MRKAIEGQIQSFGQTPSQLLTEPHPPRGSALHVCPSIFTPLTQEVCLRVKLPSNSPIVAVFAHTHPTLTSQPAVVTVAANYVFAVNRWNNAAAGDLLFSFSAANCGFSVCLCACPRKSNLVGSSNVVINDV
ncbi:unnamed protein product [Schistocephalus solidus]|uniref:BEACH domain-containing protein n=1 Tax=Schistocephalus solidus TaxID=70667 RepID=A0A3P7D7F4_SCHSO|nr:unnamed protein product [Schistocephalus solidus]